MYYVFQTSEHLLRVIHFALIVPLKNIQVENVSLNNIADIFTKSQCFKYTEINAVSGSRLDMKRIKSKGMTYCVGIYYVFEDQRHNILMNMRVAVSDTDSSRPPVL